MLPDAFFFFTFGLSVRAFFLISIKDCVRVCVTVCIVAGREGFKFGVRSLISRSSAPARGFVFDGSAAWVG